MMIKISISDCAMLYLLWQVSYCTYSIHSLHIILWIYKLLNMCVLLCVSAVICFCIMSAYMQIVESEFHINFYVQKLPGKYQYLCVVLL